MKKIYLIFLLLVFNGTSIFSQISKTHYIPPITSNGPSSTNTAYIGEQWIYISTPSKDDVTFEILDLATGAITTDTVKNDDPYSLLLASNESSSTLVVPKTAVGSVINDKGYKITATCPIYVSIRFFASPSLWQAGALTSKGSSGLGTHFRTAMMPMGNKTTPVLNSNFTSYISVMATRDNTIVKATLPNATGSANIIGVPGFSAGTPLEFDLNENESITLAIDAESGSGDRRFALFGALIESVDSSGNQDPTKPVAVNVGSGNGTFHETDGGQDIAVDQIVPINNVGHEYIFIRTEGDDSKENVILVADIDGTEIYIGDDITPTNTLNAGEFIIIEGDKFNGSSAGASMFVRTQGDSYPVFAFQGVGGPDIPNQGMFFVPPLSEDAQDNIDNIAQIHKIGSETLSGRISIVYKYGATLEVNTGEKSGGTYTYNPVDLSGIVSNAVVGKNGYKTYQIDGLEGDIQVISDDELYVAYFNISGAASSGGFYAGFATPPAAAISLDLESLGACVEFDPVNGDYKFNGDGFQINNSAFFDEWEWQEKSGSSWDTADGSALNDLNFKPTKSGKYRLRGVISCLGPAGEIYSSVIPVSICPTDFDEDGISDNIDLDLDNDGILNSIESLGDVSFDLSDLNNPVVSNSGATLSITMNPNINSLINGAPDTTTLNSIVGLNNGDFETTIPPISGNASISYEINSLSQNLNLKITAQAIAHSIVSGEYFEIEVTDSNKNITLLDPNNQLLVDTNSDEITFDELNDVNELKQYNAPLIRFKFNPSVTTIPDFEFLAFNVDGIKFTHFVGDNTNDGSFKGNISAFDYFLDTDSDNTPDYFDLDSDDDGCYDVVEAGFEDADADGIFGVGVPTYPNSEVDSRGLVIGQNYTILPTDDGSGNYYFQQPDQPVSITSTGQPTNQSACIGEPAVFEVVEAIQLGGIFLINGSF